MNKEEYEYYVKVATENLEGIHFSSGSLMEECRECTYSHPGAEYEDGICYEVEPSFSYWPCSICGSTDGGNRTPTHGYDIDRLMHLFGCDDCVYFAEYGRLNDMAML